MLLTVSEQPYKKPYTRFIVYSVTNFDGRKCQFLHAVEVFNGPRKYRFISSPFSFSDVAIFDTKCKARIAWQRDGKGKELIIMPELGFHGPQVYCIPPGVFPLLVISLLYQGFDMSNSSNEELNYENIQRYSK